MKKQLLLTRMLLLVALLVGSVSAWGQAAVNTVLWSEDFSGFANNVDPSGSYTNSHTGTTVYGDVSVTYSKYNGGGTTQTYTSGGPNGNANLLIAKKNGTFSVAGISTGGATELTVNYATSGSGTIAISSSTTNVTISGSTITTNGASTIQLTFENTNSSSNLRIDDISVIVKTAGTATKVSIPSFSPVAGAVAEGTTVTISSETTGSTIYYTTNGVDPTTSSAHGTAGDASATVTVSAAMTIKAIAVKDGLDNSDVASASYTIAAPCATPKFSVAAGEVDKGTTINISSTTEGSTIYYTTNGDTPTTSSQHGTEGDASATVTVDAAMTIKAIAVNDGNANSEVASITYTVKDYTSLPFEWDGGSSSSFNNLSGVTTSGLGSDYADSNAPYLIKFDTTDDFIQIKTNAQPGRVSIGVKMIGGKNTSTITVQESADGTNFDEVEELSISGSQNNVLTLLTTKNFKSTTRYLKFVFTKGSNVGVGPITITGCEAVEVSALGYATFASDEKLDFTGTAISAYKATVAGTTVDFTQVNVVPAGEGVLLYADGGESINVPVTTADADDFTGNKLVRGTGDALTYAAGTAEYYILANETAGIGFYKANNNTVATNRAYLDLTGANAKSITMPGGETDGIRSIDNSELRVENSNYYNLAGQRVGKDYKGIVIVNGKKLLRK